MVVPLPLTPTTMLPSGWRRWSRTQAVLVALPPEDAALVVEKGSVALDGVSLTVVEAEEDFFGVRLIPVTLAETALAARAPGALINVEYDIIGRYVIRQLEVADQARSKTSSITMDTLRDAGFF